MDSFGSSHINYIYLISFMDTFSIGISIPLLAPYLRSIGASHLAIGLSSSLYGVAQLLSGPLVGSWSDHNERLSVLSISLGASSICYLLIGLSQSIYVILMLRFIIGCFKHTQSLCTAIIADTVPTDQYTKACGTFFAISSIGFVLGPAIGGHMAQRSNSILPACITIAVCFWFNIALASIFPPYQQVKKQLKRSASSQHFWVFTHLKNIKWNSHKTILMLKFCLVFCTALYFNNLNFSVLLKEKYAVSATFAGYIISFQALIQSVSAFALGRAKSVLSFKGATKFSVGHCFVVLTVATAGLHYSPTISMLLIWLVPFSVSQSLLRSFLAELLIEKTTASERGSLLGVSESISGLGRMSAPVLAGIAIDYLNESAVPLTALIAAALGAFLSFV